jgi:hypothetical protein
VIFATASTDQASHWGVWILAPLLLRNPPPAAPQAVADRHAPLRLHLHFGTPSPCSMALPAGFQPFWLNLDTPQQN